MTAGQTLLSIADYLAQAVVLQAVSDTPRLDIEVLLCACLGHDRSYLYTWPEKHLDAQQRQCMQTWLARRQSGEPIAYIIGRREFWSLSLSVNNSTLIPRPDTERLVECALELALSETATVVDAGTGSGAIALALASERPRWSVLALELNAAACQLAQRNCRRHQLTNVHLVRGCWLSALAEKTVDMIVSNPPYIDAEDEHLCQGDVRFEPRSALVAAQQGLADIETLLSEAKTVLADNAWLLVEHGWQQAQAVQSLFGKYGFSQVNSVPDYAGRLRVTLGCHS